MNPSSKYLLFYYNFEVKGHPSASAGLEELKVLIISTCAGVAAGSVTLIDTSTPSTLYYTLGAAEYTYQIDHFTIISPNDLCSADSIEVWIT